MLGVRMGVAEFLKSKTGMALIVIIIVILLVIALWYGGVIKF
jgi:hypothetical protein